jgi:Flp pilus assembly pilin Flp
MTLNSLMKAIKDALNNRGQSMVEYVLILGLIVLAVIASLSPFGEILEVKLTEFAEAIINS